MNDKLETYYADINDCIGITCVSFVDNPAMETEWLKFSKEEEVLKFSVTNEMEHKILAVICRADFPILRVKPNGEYYNIVFPKETIKEMAKLLLTNNYQNDVNLEHNPFNFIEGVVMEQIFIKDSTKGVSPIGFENIEEGSLFGIYKINNNEIWDEIVKGTWRGISMECIVNLNEEIKENNKELKSNKMSKLEKLKELIIEMMSEEQVEVKFGSTTTDNGIVIYWDGEELEVGKQIQIEDENGNKVNATEDYTITMEDYIVTIEKGIVTDIKEVEKEVEEPTEEEVTEEVVAEEVENPTNEGEESDTEAIVKLREEVNELYSIVNELKKELEELKSKPTTESVEQEFEQVTKKELKGASRYTQYIKK